MIYKRISNPVRYAIILALTVLGFSTKVKAQMVGPDAYIKANHLEIGIDGSGGFEGADMTASPPVTGMHPRSGSPATNYFGFVANPQLNAWATYDGDFFTPGSPENGWGFEIGTTGTSRGNNCNFLNQINGAMTGWSHNAICYSTDWEGDFTSGTNLHFKINYFLQENDLYYTTTVSITNNTAANIPAMYYYRNVDPDNNQALSGDYDTQNTIVSQPGTGCNLAHVSATQSSPWTSYLGLAAIGANWRADYGGFSNRDASDLWTGSGFTQVAGSSNFADEAIALAYRIQNLAPGATETFKFVVILDNASATNAINNLLYFSYPGAAGAPSSGCSAVSDTVGTCGNPVNISVQGSNVGDYTWTWSPSTGLSSTSGAITSANPGVTTTYTASGTPLSACISPVTMSVVVEVTPGGANPVISPIAPFCISSPADTLTADSTGGIWSGTGITNGTAGIFDPSVSGIGTFMVTYTTPGGCSTTDTAQVVVANTYDATIIQPASICFSGSPVTLSSITSGGTWSGTGITSASGGVFDPSVAGIGFHVITYSFSGACAATDTATIEVVAVFDPTITQPADVCQLSGAFNLTSAHPDGIWSGSGITDSINGTFNPLISGPQTIIYSITGACGNSDTVNFNVIPTPNVNITPVPTVCISTPAFNLTVDSTGGTWAGTGITNTALGTFNPATAGLGTHLITYSTTGICNTLDSVSITVVNTFDATIIHPPSICLSGSAVTLTSVTSGGSWSGTGITSASGGVFDPSIAGVGFHVITYTISGACSDTDTDTVEVTTMFDPTITQAADICQFSPPITLTAAHPGGIWSGAGITDSVNGIFNPTGLGLQNIYYTISGACGSSDTMNFTVITTPNVTISYVPPLCLASPAINLTADSTGGVWAGTGITNSALGTFNPAVAGLGTHLITYATSGSCNTLDSVYVFVTTFSDATITQSPSVCLTGSVVTFSAVTPGGVWSGTGITSPATAGTFDPSVAGVGTHLITYTISGSCANQDTMLVDVVTIFDATITQPPNICVGSPAFNLIAAHPGGTFAGTNITNAVNGTFNPVTAGTFPVTYTITGLCANSSSINVNVLNYADATISSVPSMCVDADPVNLTAVTGGGVWSGGPIGAVNSSTGVFDPAVSGSGTFVITYAVAGMCGDTATRNITVNPLPVPSFTSDENVGCNPLCVQFSEASSPSCISIHYNFGDGDSSNVSSPSHCYDSSSVFHVSVTCTDFNGCKGTTIDSNMITVNPVPTAEFVIAPVSEAAINTTVTFTNQSTAGTSSLWTFGDGSPFNNSSVLFNTSHVYAATGSMCATLISTTPAGCSDTVSHCIDLVDPAVVPPNIFTPNGDGENDTWSVRCAGIKEFNCVIFDRWGIKMGEMNSVSEATQGWSGKTKGGSPCHDGTYYYVIKAVTLLDKNIEMAGYFQLLGN